VLLCLFLPFSSSCSSCLLPLLPSPDIFILSLSLRSLFVPALSCGHSRSMFVACVACLCYVPAVHVLSFSSAEYPSSLSFSDSLQSQPRRLPRHSSWRARSADFYRHSCWVRVYSKGRLVCPGVLFGAVAWF
jgi:hypothetical protein